MRTTEEYAAMIPTAPPFDLVGYLREKGKMQTEVISYKWLGRDDADSWMDCEDCQKDLRPSAATKSALMWCSACGGRFLAEYIPRGNTAASNAWGGAGYSGVRIADAEVTEIISYREYDKLCCPLCGAETVLYSTNSLRYGLGNQEFVVVPTVAESCLVLTQWCIERRIYDGRAAMCETAVNAYIAVGGKIIKLAHYQRNAMAGTWKSLGEWKRRAKLADDIGAPLMYGRDLPDLAGTCVENAKLWEYMEQAEAGGTAYPVAYLRLYFKHPAVENLITAGLGKLVGTGIRDDHRHRYGYGYSTGSMTAAPKLDWVNWKENRPARMIGLDKQQLKTWQQMGFGLACLMVWKKHKLANDVSFADCCTLMAAVGPTSADEILMAGVPPIRTANYLKRQGQAWNYLEDYWRMARLAGYDLDQDVVRWPKVLQRAHDRAAAAVKYQKINSTTKEAFAKMTDRCQGLAWEHDGICIRPAASPLELIEEGNTLRHCVGGYAGTHAMGKIILFVRHTRRPDRSWYTLNINVLTKEEIQLHGYRNEMVDGKRLKIPQRVREFVDLWEREVLAKWQLPPEKAAPKKKSRFAAAASVA